MPILERIFWRHEVSRESGLGEVTYCPYKQTTQPQFVSKVDLLLESFFIVVRDPLVLIPHDILDGVFFVVYRSELLLINDLCDFFI